MTKHKTRKPLFSDFDEERDIFSKVVSLGTGVAKEVASQGVGTAQELLDFMVGKSSTTGGEVEKRLENTERKEIPQEQVQPKKANLEALGRGESVEVFSFERYKAAREVEQVRRDLVVAVKELKSLGAQTGEIEKAIFMQTAEVSTYHLNFFMRLREIIKVLRKSIAESKTWLTAMQSKKKRQSYWSQAKKKGTQWSMNSERALASSAG